MSLNVQPDFMKTAVNVSAFCLLSLLGLFQPRFTYACGDPPPLPEITDAAWDEGVDNWFGRFNVGVGMNPGLSFSTSCPSGCCGGYGMDFRYFLDGVEQFCGGYTCAPYMFWLPNGAHTLRKDIRLFSGFPGDEERPPFNYQEITYPFSKTFYTDNDAPVITIAQPGNNVTVTTANASVAVNVSDPLSKLEIVNFALKTFSALANTACGVKKDLSGVEIDSTTTSESKISYCSNQLVLSSTTHCDENIYVSAGLSRIYDLRDYVDFSSGLDCRLAFSASAMDRVGNSTWTVGVSFIVDQEPPAITISSWPVVLSSGPATLIAGTALDASEIKYLKFNLSQMDWKGTTTYWDGGDWVTNPDTKIPLTIPEDTITGYWTYSGLTAKKMVSGSQYTLTVYSADKFDHERILEQQFAYNACPYTAEKIPLFETEKKFEVADAVFRKKKDLVPAFLGLNHAGVYVVSDSNYQQNQSSADFVNDLKSITSLRNITNSSGQHYIVHAAGKFVTGVSLQEFMISEDKYRGARTSKTTLDADTRDRIAYNAAIQLGKPYHPIDMNWAGGKPENSSGRVRNNPVGFRCDGLIVYAYLKAGVADVFPSEVGITHWTEQGPNQLYHDYMTAAVVERPTGEKATVTPNGDRFDISIPVKDAGSGIDRVQHYLYSSNNGFLSQQVLSEDDTDSVPPKVYLSTCGCNPGTNLVTRLVDRAGNWTLYDSSLDEVAVSSPSTPSIPLEQDSPPILGGAVIQSQNSYLDYNITSVSDDITPESETQLFYRVDQPFEEWDDDVKTAIPGSGLAQGKFAVSPGTHKLYAAVMDEALNFATTVKEFKVPGLASAGLGSGARVTIGDVALSFDNLTSLASVSANDTNVGNLPSGYSHLARQLSKELTIDGTYQGGFLVVMNYGSYGVTPEQEPYLQMLHNGQNITVALDRINKLIAGYSTSASPFTVAVSPQLSPETALPDMWPPLTGLGVAEDPYVDSQGRRYISSTTLIGLAAEDDRGGNINTYYIPQMTEPLFEAGLVPGSLGQFTHYSSSFTLPEGVRWAGYGSMDASSNYELLKTTTFYVDGTPPVSEIYAGTITVPDGGSAYITEFDSVTVSAFDPEISLVASGLARKYFLVDTAPASCGDEEEDPAASVGTCQNPTYSEPFTLPVGTHTIYYTAVDNVGNVKAEKSAFINVLPPIVLTSLSINPSFVFLESGGSRQFSIIGNFSDGTSRALDSSDGLAWSVDHGTVAAVSPGGLVSGVAYGKTRVRAGAGGLAAEAYLFVYDPIAPSFAATGPMTVPRHIHTATLLPDGKVLVAGGNNGSQTLSSVELYDPATGKFTATGSMSVPRSRGHAATLLPGGKVLLTGGISGNITVATAELYDPATGRFTTTGSMAAPRYNHTATLLADGKVLIAGGANDNGTVSQAELYDPAAGTFSAAGAMARARYTHDAALLADGRVLLAGGLAAPGSGYLSSAELYNPVTRTFSATGSMSAARAYTKAVLLWSGEVLLAGGSNGSAAVLAGEVYDPVTGSFSAAGSLSEGRLAGHTATLLPDGKVLVAGGDEYGNNISLSAAEIYDPATRTFSTTVPMNSGRIFHAAALLLPNGKVLVCGGNKNGATISTAELYNFGFGAPVTLASITVSPSSATIEVGGTLQFTAVGNFSDGSSRPLGAGLAWSVDFSSVAAITSGGLATGAALGKARVMVSSGSLSAAAVLTVAPPQPRFIATGPMQTARHIHTATLLADGRVLVAGGNNGAQMLSSAELYDPAAGKFTATAPMAAPRGRGHAATLLPGGKVLVTGGIDASRITSSAELYDPATGAFSPTGPMAAARYAHTATLLPDGKVLVAGGAGDNGLVAQAELYDPAAGTFSAAGPMAARYMHAAALLGDGRVLLAGGLTGLGSGPVTSAEVYNPVTKAFSAAGPMNAARAYPRIVLLADGRVLVTGGFNGSSAVLLSELYEPGSKSFTATGSMSVGRLAGHTATMLPDGKVLVAGGDENGGNSAVSSAEVYDPAAGAFSVTAPMSMGRIYHTAALLLPNGKVLVCGGYNGSASVASAELYDSGFRGSLSPMLNSLVVSPSTASIAAGGARQFTAYGNFSDGSGRLLSAADGLSWSVGHATVAAIGADGSVTGIAYGKTGVKASSGIFSAEAGLAVFHAPSVSVDGLVSINAPDVQLSVTAVSTLTVTSTAPIFAAMSWAGLRPAMDAFYDLQPGGVQFASPVKLSFTFDPDLVAGSTVAIYYFDGVAWSSASIAGQTIGLLADGRAYVEGYISHTSIYAALYFRDIVPPVTGLVYTGPKYGAKPVYISTCTVLSLAAYDDAASPGDRLGGLAASYYAVDLEAFRVYTGTFSVAGEGSHVIGYYSVDGAGNSEALNTVEVAVDAEPAVSAVLLDGRAGRNGWFVSPAAATLTSTDSLSGVAGAYYALGGAPFALYSSSFGITGEGVYSLKHYAVDNIGNREAEKSVNFGIDLSTPVITYARTPAPNAAGWNNTPVSVVFEGTDTISGIAYCTPAISLETEGAGQAVSGYCADYAGWSSTAALTLNIDRTAPAITVSSPAAGNVFVATRDRIGLFFTAADNLDPAPKTSARLTQLEDKGSPRGGRPAVIAVTYGQALEPLDIDDGLWRLTVSATDFADNTNTLSGGAFEVVHDVLAPRTTRAIAGGVSLAAGVTTYITGDTVLKLSSADDLVLAEDGLGLGVKNQAAGIRAAGLPIKELVFENPEPNQGLVFDSTFTAGGLGLADGIYGLAYHAEDVLGNIETEKIFTIGLDNTAPVTTAGLAGTAGENGWHISTVTVSLSAADALAGVAAIYYQSELNGQKSETRNYAEPFTAGVDGLYKVYFYAKDKLGNTEAEKTIAFRIDLAAPVVSTAITPPANADGWHNTPAGVVFSGTDSVSGLAYCEPEKTVNTEGGDITVSGYCRDYAGNSSTVAVKLSMDLTDPLINAERSPANAYGWNKAPVTVKYLCTDGLSGVKSCSPAATLAGEGSLQSASGEALDKAGNSSSAAVTGINIDKTAPVSKHGTSGIAYSPETGKIFLNPASGIFLNAADPVSGGTASGIDSVEYYVDSEPFAVYSASFSLGEGVRTVNYRSRDKAGNVEAVSSAAFQVDGTAPESRWLASSGDRIEKDGKFYLNALGSIALESADPLAANVASGLENIYYGIDAAPATKYTSMFGLGEGVRMLNYKAKDNVGNTEVVKSTVIYADGTKPVTELTISGDQYKNGRQYISQRTDVIITAADPVVNEVSVGVKETKYMIDGGAFADYSQFKLSAEGKRVVSFYSADQVNNIEAAKTAELWVDATAPLSSINIMGGRQYTGTEPGSFYASLATEYGFAAVDPVANGGAAGVRAIEYTDNGSLSAVYAQPIALGEGKHTITYRATDRVENIEVFRSTHIYVDNTAPVTAFNISEPLYIKEGVRFISPASGITFAANDPTIKEVAVGVERIETAIDGGQWLRYTQALKFAEGRHTIKYRAIDNVGNEEAERSLEVQSDATAPESRWLASGDRIEKGEKFYLNALGSIALESADPVVSSVASGVEGIYYGIDVPAANKYSAPFGLIEGRRTVNFSAKDNVNNTEVVKSTVIYVDGTKPLTELSLSGDQSHSDKQYISQRTDIVITAADPVVSEVSVGVKETKYTVDGGAFSDYSQFKLNTEGRRIVSFYSSDYVNNVEAVKAAELWVDNTAPATALSINGVRYAAPGDEKLYLTRDSGIVLTPADPLSNDTASGVMLTKYRIDGGNWQVYLGSFTIAAEGLHTLEYYSLDRVQNAEATKSVIIAVDNTPSVSAITFDGSGAETFGLPVITPATRIILSAADPAVNGAASGLNSIFYEIENIRTGALAPVTPYITPFTIPGQGTYMIRYWSRDNTGNIETPKERMAAVTTWRADALAAVSGLEMSGTADIAGAVRSNAVVSLGGNARILGDVTASTITISGKAEITGLEVSGAVPVDPAPIYLGGIAQSAAAVNNNALVAAYLVDGKLTLGAKTGITLTTGTYYFKGLDLGGGSSITIAGKVDILVEGGMVINGGNSINASGAASLLSIIISTSSELRFNGGAAIAACIYAPYSDMKLAGNGLLGGHYFVRTANLSGVGNIIQSGETLPQAAAAAGEAGGKKKVSALAAGGAYNVLAGPDPAFRLGEVYVFPNPAKGAEVPTFHIETGIADSVKITIYTISGRQAHEYTITSPPVALDDGNGLSYTYEYAWRGHIPSGVYLYYIEAWKAGQKLKKTGKFSVIK